MTPGFALSLTIDGIVLLARAAGGWRVAGRATLEADDLAASLAELRARAVALEDEAFRTKLIVPNDQIRYLSVDTGHVATADRITQVRQALDGATPYAVEDLVYDICVDGPMTHVAAVARETLDEAEAFAIEHRFNPVSFVAVPGDAAFLGEPFFGPTSFSEKALTPGTRVEPDGVVVVVIGDVDEEDDAPVAEVNPVEPPIEIAVSADTEEPEEATPSPSVEPEFVSVAAAARDGDAELEVPEATPAVGFSSRRLSQIPELGGVSRSTIAPRIDDDDASPAPDPAFLAASFDAPDVLDEDDAADVEPPQKWAARFLSRRADAKPEPEASKRATVPPAPVPRAPVLPRTVPVAAGSPAHLVDDENNADERNRMTIFGMRDKADVKEPKSAPRHLGLILTAILLIFLAGVAAWAAVFMEEEIAALFDRDDDLKPIDAPANALSSPDPVTEQQPTIDVATLGPAQPELSDTDAAVLDALRPEPEIAEPEAPALLDIEDVETNYAVTGIWPKAPDALAAPGVIGLDDLYITSIDAAVDARDAIALPATELFETDQALAQVISPAAPEAQFAFDENGRVVPTPEGALSPDGFTVVLGPPPVVPPPTPERTEPEEIVATAAPALPDVRPRLRPDDLVEQTERSQLGGLTLSELSGVRPQIRPEVEKTEEEADQTPTAQAVQASITPRQRPVNMAQLVAAAQNAQQRSSQSQVAAAATAAAATRTVAATTVTPRVPSTASVSRAATVNNAINLRRVNLIGVYGTSANRRALVRLPNGRYRKVEVGDRLDGGRISAIGESELRYQKGGRNVVLRIPSS